MRVNVGAQNGIHACKVSVALSLEPVEYVAVNAKVHGRFAARHDDPGAFPKIIADRRGFRRGGACPACAASDFLFDRSKRISHDSIFLCHIDLPSMR